MFRGVGISIIGLILTVVVSLIAYVTVYNVKINRQLQSGNVNGKQWPTPKNVVFTVVVVFLVIYLLVEMSDKDSGNNGQVYSVNRYADYATYTSETMKGTEYEIYAKAFETGELTGYEKVEKTEKDFHYMYFRSQEYDILHPAFVLFVEYVGDAEIRSYMDEGRIHNSEDSSWGSGGGGDASEYYCVIGNMDFDKVLGFSYELGVYGINGMPDKEAEMDGMEGAVSKVSIWID